MFDVSAIKVGDLITVGKFVFIGEVTNIYYESTRVVYRYIVKSHTNSKFVGRTYSASHVAVQKIEDPNEIMKSIL